MQSKEQKQMQKPLSTIRANVRGVEKEFPIHDDGAVQTVETNILNTQRSKFNIWDFKFPRTYKERYGVEYKISENPSVVIKLIRMFKKELNATNNS